MSKARITTRLLLISWCVVVLVAYAIAWIYLATMFIPELEASRLYAFLAVTLVGSTGFVAILFRHVLRSRWIRRSRRGFEVIPTTERPEESTTSDRPCGYSCERERGESTAEREVGTP
jgi:hypothetical protein